VRILRQQHWQLALEDAVTREHFPENALAKGAVCILQMRLCIPLKLL
jgi:hypothetical protein